MIFSLRAGERGREAGRGRDVFHTLTPVFPENPRELPIALCDAAAGWRHRSGAAAVVTPDRPHREPRDLPVLPYIAQQQASVCRREEFSSGIVLADHGSNPQAGG